MSHVLDKFQFCPVCGSNHFEINNIKSKKCKDCGFSYYLNPSSATVALILNSKEELLAVRRKKDPAKGHSICQAVLLTWMKQVKKVWQER